MSNRISVMTVTAAIFSVLIFVAIIGNSGVRNNAPASQVNYTPAFNNARPAFPVGHREADERFIAETVLSECEKRCRREYGSFMTDDFSKFCRNTCHEIWDKNIASNWNSPQDR